MENRAPEGDVMPTPPTQRLGTEPASSGGFISVAVLWILGALSVLVSVYAVYVLNTTAAFATYDSQLKSDALVSAALEVTAYRQQKTAALSRPSQGSFGFRLGQANVDVEFHSEMARIDLNAAPKPLLAGLFITLGARPEDAEAYADRVIAWRTARTNEQDPEISTYRMSRLDYQPRGGKFPHPNELTLVRGLPPALVERVLPFVTTYSGSSQINVLDAAPEIVASLPGMTQDRLDAFLAQRQGSPNAKQLLPESTQQFVTLESVQTFRIKVRTFDSGRIASAEVVILLFDDGDQPFAVLSWRDRSTELLGY